MGSALYTYIYEQEEIASREHLMKTLQQSYNGWDGSVEMNVLLACVLLVEFHKRTIFKCLKVSEKGARGCTLLVLILNFTY